ncbi:MAG: right-handed parallel beta-helix repeat-containing protein, partial [Oscillospiraceae bacterium]|nr:right-handed parallel beta-helix repeat-containing protein [Oscillospiraceae bacterium]
RSAQASARPPPQAPPTPAPAPAEPAEAAAPTPAPSAEPKAVEAATVEDFLKAIAPNTTIRLTGRSYDLSRALGYGNFSGDWYDWEDLYDGWGLVISGVENLRIEAARPGTEIVTEPRHAIVMRFDNCSGLSLSGLTVGHTSGEGYCSGSVLYFKSCADVAVEDCELYGCGTYALELERSHDVSCRRSILRDCSYGAMNASASSRVVLDDCTIYGISENEYMPVISMSNCSGCALINSFIRSCTASELLHLSYVRDFYLGGCEIVNNSFNGMFYSSNFPITVDGCSFRGNDLQQGWYYSTWDGVQSERCVDAEGKTYEDYALYDLELKSVSWTPPAEAVPEAKPVEVSDDGMIHVNNVDELLASIAPGVTIYLEDGVYALADATGFGTYTGEYYYWMHCYDGPGLVITGVDDLTITAGGPHRATITAEPRYADVISFEGCSFITLKNFTAGHTQEPGSCSGGVLNFQDSGRIIVMDCSLYGCGVLGIQAYSCNDLQVRYTEIHDCSDGAFFFNNCEGVTVERCNIHDIAGYTYQTYDCKNITADGRTIPDGVSW